MTISSNLSGKMLSGRLKELVENGIIEKIIVNIFPTLIKYRLTDKGNMLKYLLFDLSHFGLMDLSRDVSGENVLEKDEDTIRSIEIIGKFLKLNTKEIKNRISLFREDTGLYYYLPFRPNND